MQRPQTLDEAQDAAITFENSRRARRVTFPADERGTTPATGDRKRRRDRESVTDDGNKSKRSRTRTPEQQPALAELRALRNARDKCWSCGQAGHMREQCKEKADEDRAAFATKKEKLKAIINNGREA